VVAGATTADNEVLLRARLATAPVAIQAVHSP
jgi:hypothetical protein